MKLCHVTKRNRLSNTDATTCPGDTCADELLDDFTAPAEFPLGSNFVKLVWDLLWANIGRSRLHEESQPRVLDAGTAPTPTDEDVAPEVLPLREEGDGQQSVEVEALHQQPEEARHDAIMEENHHCFAAHLEEDGDAGEGPDPIPSHTEHLTPNTTGWLI